MPKIPAASPTTAPRRSFVSFSKISALASSISSRTSSEARSETSVIVCARLAARWGSSTAKAPEDHRGEQAAGERADHRHLGTFADHLRDRGPDLPDRYPGALEAGEQVAWARRAGVGHRRVTP